MAIYAEKVGFSLSNIFVVMDLRDQKKQMLSLLDLVKIKK